MASGSEIPQYDLPRREVELLKQQAARRAVKRQEFIKQTTNPFRESGYIFDPAVQRYIALKASQYDYFKMTPKTSSYGMLVGIIPFVIYGYVLYKDRSTREHSFRTGQVAYRDREWKFV